MCAAGPNAGTIYIRSPNNPAGKPTSRADIEYVLANKPASNILILDAAHLHHSKNAVPGSGLVAADKDVIISRTFSKHHGMAGLGAAPPSGVRTC